MDSLVLLKFIQEHPDVEISITYDIMQRTHQIKMSMYDEKAQMPKIVGFQFSMDEMILTRVDMEYYLQTNLEKMYNMYTK